MQAETLAVAAERPERLHRPGSLDHLFGGSEQHGRHGNAQRFRGLDVGHQIVSIGIQSGPQICIQKGPL